MLLWRFQRPQWASHSLLNMAWPKPPKVLLKEDLGALRSAPWGSLGLWGEGESPFTAWDSGEKNIQLGGIMDQKEFLPAWGWSWEQSSSCDNHTSLHPRNWCLQRHREPRRTGQGCVHKGSSVRSGICASKFPTSSTTTTAPFSASQTAGRTEAAGSLKAPLISRPGTDQYLGLIRPPVKRVLGALPLCGTPGNCYMANKGAEVPILWPPDMKSQLTGKDPDSGKDWGQEEKWATEDKMVGWHHWLNGHEFEQLWEIVKDREAWCAAVYEVIKSRHDWATEQ